MKVVPVEDFFLECGNAIIENEGVITHVRIGNVEFQLYNASKEDTELLEAAFYRLGAYEKSRRLADG